MNPRAHWYPFTPGKVKFVRMDKVTTGYDIYYREEDYPNDCWSKELKVMHYDTDCWITAQCDFSNKFTACLD